MSNDSSRGMPSVVAAQTDHRAAQGAVVHVDAAMPGDSARVDLVRVAVEDRVVDRGGEQVVGGGHGVQVAGEVQVDVVGRLDDREPTAGPAALDPEDRPHRGLAQGDGRARAAGAHRLGQPDRRGRLALARGGRGHARHEHQFALRRVGQLGQRVDASAWPSIARRVRARPRPGRAPPPRPQSAAFRHPSARRVRPGSCAAALNLPHLQRSTVTFTSVILRELTIRAMFQSPGWEMLSGIAATSQGGIRSSKR